MVTLSDIINFEGRRVLVTGAVSGIGRAVALRCCEAGAEIIAVDIDANGLKEMKEEFEKSGGKIEIYKVDMAKEEEILRLWENLGNNLPDTIVNNAGVYPFKNFKEVDKEFLYKVMEINFFSVFWMCQKFIDKRGKEGGIIVNIGSIEAIMPFKRDMAQYSMSKVGVIALTRDLAREFGREGFRVNCILPGGIVSNGTKGAAMDILKGNIGLLVDGFNFFQRLPAGRMGEADDIAKMVLVLASDFASYMHGAIIPVDGGFLSC